MPTADDVELNSRLDCDAKWSVSSLLGEYCATLDSRRTDEWAELFVADGRLELPTAAIVGREKLKRFAARSPRGIHVSGTPFISGTPDAINSVCSWTFVDLDTGTQIVGYYRDQIVWQAGRHRFRIRQIEMHTPPSSA